MEARIPDHPLIRAQAAMLTLPSGSVVSHQSAAALYGLPVPTHHDVHVLVPTAADRRTQPGLVCHVGRARTKDVAGVPVAEYGDVFRQLASVLSLVDLVVVGDAMVRAGFTTPAALREACAQSTGRHSVRARRAADLVRAGAESPMETRLRLLIVLAGLPEPAINRSFEFDRAGAVRLDLSYPDLFLAIEYDGRQHADDIRQWHRDLVRREALDAAGWRLVVVTSAGIFRDPEQTVARIVEALAARGVRARPGHSWRHHFPGR